MEDKYREETVVKEFFVDMMLKVRKEIGEFKFGNLLNEFNLTQDIITPSS